ncbi:uncharacterized protein BXZ73DRAFT_50427 [Epithele typhae]|uniref:uncharacterized protein n=1 Tax=Epithele typhae TaxID=378194 RepID=UPI002007BAF9|nr:uncharacterized protein BXZ73DRAFT_50427 [Epithele typhae]KAH9924621.1 hypothetical protein BXZ73DRAFT_50427 [Epithele typhae]
MDILTPSHPAPDPLSWLDDLSAIQNSCLGSVSTSPSGSGTGPTDLSPFSDTLTPPHARSSSEDKSENERLSDPGYASNSSDASDTSSSSRHHKKARIALDPTQPLTAKGQPRARVYVACSECRSRKIRCDGGKPVCFNCHRRDSSLEKCSYDSAPKRRGQDKVPGSRTRSAHDKKGARNRRPLDGDDDGDDDDHSFQSRAVIIREFDPGNFDPDDVDSFRLPSPPIITAREKEDDAEAQESRNITAVPSMNFTRDTWWDALLTIYASDHPHGAGDLMPARLRQLSTQRVFSDVRALLRASLYWASFMHLPRFFETLLDPTRRNTCQPSLLLSMLAVGALVQCSKGGDGVKGRERADKLMDHAHSAIQASLSSNWVDIGLVQAAWFMAYYELHGRESMSEKMQRVRSAKVLLDSLIRLLALARLDADVPSSHYGLFATSEQFIRTGNSNLAVLQSVHSISSPVPPFPPTTTDTVATLRPGHAKVETGARCECEKYTLKQQWPTVSAVAPLWQSTAMWPKEDETTEGELRKEEGRRVVWSSIMLVASCNSASKSAQGPDAPFVSDLFIEDHRNFAIMFPGDVLRHLGVIPLLQYNVWNCCLRSMILWHSSVRMRSDPNVEPTERAQFATQAWLEADAIEAALNAHSCGLEAGCLYQAREYLFNCRMAVSQEFRQFAPLVTSQHITAIYRDKAQTWLKNQKWVAEWLWSGLGDPDNVLSARPLLIFWFMGHVIRALEIFDYDPTLTIALETAKASSKPLEYLLRLWPSQYQNEKWEVARMKLVRSCLEAGVEPPSPEILLPRHKQPSNELTTTGSSNGPPAPAS